MAKISIDDRTDPKGEQEGQILPAKTRDLMYQAISAGLERLGPLAKMLEVVKVSPISVEAGSELINIKLVFIDPDIDDTRKVTRTEHDFRVFCNDNVVNFLQQRLVQNFKKLVETRAARLDTQSQKLKGVVLDLETRELVSGNNRRCFKCGSMRKDGENPCEQCREKQRPIESDPRRTQSPVHQQDSVISDPHGPFGQEAPSCPKCGHVTIRSGETFKCLNCGNIIGTQEPL